MVSRRTFGPIRRGHWMGKASCQLEGRMRETPSSKSLWAPPLDGWPFAGYDALRDLATSALGSGGAAQALVRERVFGEVEF